MYNLSDMFNSSREKRKRIQKKVNRKNNRKNNKFPKIEHSSYHNMSVGRDIHP